MRPTGAVVLVLVLMACVAVATAALVGPWGSAFHHGYDAVCTDAIEPTVVREDSDREWAESGAVTTSSYLPYGPRCTWTLSDGTTAATGPGWAATWALVGAVALAASSLTVLVRAQRRATSDAR